MNLAWEVEINSMSCIVFAPTKPKARWIAVKSYWEAGYGRGNGTWPSGVHAARVPMFDKSRIARETRQQAWGRDYVLGTL